MGRASIVPLASDCMGMWIGQSILQNMLPNAFRRWFFLSLLPRPRTAVAMCDVVCDAVFKATV